ncbi:hypothetical protein [Streptomyces sp. CoT10]|uniref:hypothetical protein n=1 Tax=Streptomyces sp. CoT10 TaxID=2875762 RepID=UPI001CD3706C|nr:hypothetical protein [Streptomyces sp. CoT10]
MSGRRSAGRGDSRGGRVARCSRWRSPTCAVGIANNIGTVLTGGLAPMLCSAVLLWFDHSITGVVAFIAVMSALTILTVGLARETRHTSRPDTAPRRPRDLQKAH